MTEYKSLRLRSKCPDAKQLSAEDWSYRASGVLDVGFAHTRSGDYATALWDLRGRPVRPKRRGPRDKGFCPISRGKAHRGQPSKTSLLLETQGKEKRSAITTGGHNEGKSGLRRCPRVDETAEYQ